MENQLKTRLYHSYEASVRGYGQLTSTYRMPDELWMLENVVLDMASGGIEYMIVKVDDGLQVWRKGYKLARE